MEKECEITNNDEFSEDSDHIQFSDDKKREIIQNIKETAEELIFDDELDIMEPGPSKVVKYY